MYPRCFILSIYFSFFDFFVFTTGRWTDKFSVAELVIGENGKCVRTLDFRRSLLSDGKATLSALGEKRTTEILMVEKKINVLFGDEEKSNIQSVGVLKHIGPVCNQILPLM